MCIEANKLFVFLICECQVSRSVECVFDSGKFWWESTQSQCCYNENDGEKEEDIVSFASVQNFNKELNFFIE